MSRMVEIGSSMRMRAFLKSHNIYTNVFEGILHFDSTEFKQLDPAVIHPDDETTYHELLDLCSAHLT